MLSKTDIKGNTALEEEYGGDGLFIGISFEAFLVLGIKAKIGFNVGG